MSLVEKDYKHFESDNDKQFGEVLFGRVVKTTIQTLYDRGLIDNYDNADEALKVSLNDEVNEIRRPD